MKRSFLFLGLLVFTMMVSCVEDIEQPVEGNGELRQISMSLDLNVQAEKVGYGTPVSKAEGTPTTTPIEITEFWFLEFDSDDRLISDPELYEANENVAIFLPERNGPDYKGYIVAATLGVKKANLETVFTFDNCKTLEKFLALNYATADIMVDPENTEKNPNSPGYIISGCIDIPWDINENTAEDQPTNVSCTLTRNISKFTFEFTNNVFITGAEIYSVQLHNVPKYNHYYLNNKTNEFTDFNVAIDKPITYDKDGEYSLENPQVKYEFYIPRNEQGTVVNSEAKDKNKFAPAKATYIELLGRDKTGSLLSFKFYPGANDKDDFNLKANHSYTLKIELKSYSASDDSRINKVITEILKPSNSYIINPTSNRYNSSLYAIPMAWMYKYWTKFATNKITAEQFSEGGEYNELVAEVIWQSQTAQVISFCDENALNVSDMGSFKMKPDIYIDDKGYLYIRTDGKANGQATGNMVIGVKRKPTETDPNPPYLWSWHLWFTEYAPDERKASWEEDVYIYEVTSGAVHRYADKTGTKLWSEGGTYHGKYIMDRNLGATSEKGYGLYYQCGRKDPFTSMTAQLYGIKGLGSSTIFVPTTGDAIVKEYSRPNIDVAINNPHVLYLGTSDGASEGREWTAQRTYNSYPWNNPEAYNAGDYKKGIFDPCPPGWKVPQINAFYILRTSDKANNINQGPTFYISKNPGEPGDPTMYFTRAGARGTSGSLANAGSYGYFWTSNPGGFYGAAVQSYSEYLNFTYNVYRSQALTVRCVQE